MISRRDLPSRSPYGNGRAGKTISKILREELGDIGPLVGPLTFDHAVFRHGETGELRLILYTPSCEHDTRTKLTRLLEEDAPAVVPAVA